VQFEIEPLLHGAGKGGAEFIHDKNCVKSKSINIQNSFGPPAKTNGRDKNPRNGEPRAA
jgi:hypothetical protein